ncbi:MAG: NAD(+)/NADH kinase [Candidatus Doudnabacteria bacterium]|nr:NAD(+)/NADH kinase [Candidatus Doudnabacteria bacterium]
MMRNEVVVFGASLDPPGIHHEDIVRNLSRAFDKVVVFPCGPARWDKTTVNDTPLIHRAVMTDLTFGRISRVMVDLSDLEAQKFTPNIEFEKKFGHLGKVWMAVGADLLVGGASGKSQIQSWEKDDRLWRQGRFVVLERLGYPLRPEDLPPYHRVLKISLTGSSTTIREAYRLHSANDKAVTPSVSEYIKRYGLYRSAAPKSTGSLSLTDPQLLIVWERTHERARLISGQVKHLENRRRPNGILVIGGDGTMLAAIRKYWRLRLPFIGINTGGTGFLLSDWKRKSINPFFAQTMTIHNMPLLYVEVDTLDGRTVSGVGFNDAWVERASGQTAYVEVSVDGQVRVPRLKCDSTLVSTAAGSPAYAQAMGAIPFKFDTQALALAASCARDFRPKMLPIDSQITFRNLDPRKRPLRGMIDSVDQGIISEMRIRTSKIANAELAFLPGYSFDEKLLNQQFAKW